MDRTDIRTVLCDLDRRLLIAMRSRGHDPRVERSATAFARLGEHAAAWLALGLAGAELDPDAERRRRWRRGVRTVLAADAINFAVKLAVRRTRPELPELPALISTPSRLSFPSAHATTSFAAAAAYRELAPPSLLYVVAVGLALSRPYLGVHYPSDVVAGAALGTMIARLAASGHGGDRCR